MEAIVITDDQDEKDILVFLLRKAGLAVASSSDLQRVLKNWSDHAADLMLLALSEVETNPLKSLNTVRAVTQVPLVMIVNPQIEKIVCSLLQQGADMVLERPVSPMLLTSHVQALIRRAAAIPSFVLPTLSLEGITLDPSSRMVTVHGQEPKRLTHLEFRLLYTLMKNRGQVIPADVIVERVWGYDGEGNRDLVRGLISRLRRKIEPGDAQVRFIETLPGVGYRFIVDNI